MIEKAPQLISTLTVYPVTMDTEMEYTCVANNSLGETNFTTSVIVLCKFFCSGVQLLHKQLFSNALHTPGVLIVP